MFALGLSFIALVVSCLSWRATSRNATVNEEYNRPALVPIVMLIRSVVREGQMPLYTIETTQKNVGRAAALQLSWKLSFSIGTAPVARRAEVFNTSQIIAELNQTFELKSSLKFKPDELDRLRTKGDHLFTYIDMSYESSVLRTRIEESYCYVHIGGFFRTTSAGEHIGGMSSCSSDYAKAHLH